MAIPRYKQEQIKVPGDNRRFVGQADETMAAGQRNLAQALTGLSNSQEGTAQSLMGKQNAQKQQNSAVGSMMSATGQVAGAQNAISNTYGRQASSDIQTLNQRLTAFSNTASDFMRADATRKAFKAGVVDTAERREKILRIQMEYAHDPVTMDKKINEVNTATMQDNFSIYGRIYQDTVTKSYAAQVEIDASNASMIAETESKGDPVRFKRIYTKYKEEFIKGAPNEVAHVAATKAFDKYGVVQFEAMTKAKNKAYIKQTNENMTANIKGISEMITDAASKGDSVSVHALQGQLAAIIKAQTSPGINGEAPQMGVAAGAAILQASATDAQTAEFMRYGTGAAQNGTGWNFIQKIQNPEHVYGKSFAKLPYETQQKVLKQATAQASAYDKAKTAQAEQNNKEVDLNQKQTTADMKKAMYEDGLIYEPGYLQEQVQLGEISETQMEDIIDAQKIVTDPDYKLYYSSNEVLVSMSEADIMESDRLSPEDKTAAIKQRDAALKSPLFNWTKSINGQEAVRRAKAEYNIPDSVLATVMAKAKGERTPTEQEYMDFREELFDRIQALPFEKQAESALGIYKEIKKEFAEKNEVEAETALSTQQKTKWDAAVVEANKYNDEKWFGKDKTPQDILKEQGSNDVFIDTVTEKYGGTPTPSKKVPLKTSRTAPNPKPLVIYEAPTPQYHASRPSSTMTPTVGVQTGTPGKTLPVVAYGTLNTATGMRGGSKSWRNNNPYNIGASGRYVPGAIGRASSTVGDATDRNMLVFDSAESGTQAFVDLVFRKYDDAPIEITFAKYQSDQVGFQGKLASLRNAGVPTNVRFSELSAPQQIDFMKIWKRHEGYTVGSAV